MMYYLKMNITGEEIAPDELAALCEGVSAGEVAEMLTAVRDGQVTAVLAEELYGSEMGAVVEQETDAGVYYLDTLVRGDYDRDSYLERMEQNIAILREIAAGQSLERQESGA